MESEEPEERPQPEKLPKDRIFVSSSTIKEEEEDIGSPSDDNSDNFTTATKKVVSSSQRTPADSHGTNQYAFYRMDSVTARKKSMQDTSLYQRRASIRAMRDPSYNEFSFKQSMDSSVERDGNINSPRSSSQNIELASNQSGDFSHKYEGLGFGGGLRRTATPNFNRSKPSGFLLEKRHSMRNLRPAPADSFKEISSIASILPHELKNPPRNEILLPFNKHIEEKPSNPSSIEDNYLQAKEGEFKKLSGRQSSDKPKTTGTGQKSESKGHETVNVFYQPPAKVNGETSGRVPKQNSLEQVENAGSANFIESQSDSDKLNKKPVPAENDKSKRVGNLEKDNENSRSQFKDTEQNVSTANTFISVATASTENGANGKDPTTKSANSELSGLKLSFIRRVDYPSAAGRTMWVDVSNNGGSPTKDTPDFTSTLAKEKPYFQKKLFPAQLSVHAKFNMNLLDILKDQADDLSPVLPLSRGRRTSLKGNKLLQPTGAKANTQSIDFGNGNASAQPVLPSNLLTISRQETFPENLTMKPSIPTPNKLLRRGTHEISVGGSPSAQNKSPDLDAMPNPPGHLNRFHLHTQQTMRTDNSTIYENRTIYCPEDNISTVNITKYVFNYENEEVEYDEAAGIGIKNPNILSGTLNESQTSIHRDSTVMGAIRLDSSMVLGRRDSLASSTGKDSITRKSPQPNDGFESHLQQLDEASPMGSKVGSKSSVGSTTHIPKPETKQNPHRTIRDSVFRTSPRGGQNTPARTHNTIEPVHAEPHSRGLQKAKSCVIPRVQEGNKEDEEEEANDKPKHGKTANELENPPEKSTREQETGKFHRHCYEMLMCVTLHRSHPNYSREPSRKQTHPRSQKRAQRSNVFQNANTGSS